MMTRLLPRSSVLVSCARPSVLVLLGAVLCVGCAEVTPEQRIDQIRAQYAVELTSFRIVDEPLAEPAGEDEAMGDGEQTAEVEAAGEEEMSEGEMSEGEMGEGEMGEGEMGDMDTAMVPMRTDVVIDLLVSTEAREPLDGITVELEQVDSNQQPKDRRLVWLDTSSLIRGPGVQVTEVVEDISYEDGDGFLVQIVVPVSEDERANYREFSNPGD